MKKIFIISFIIFGVTLISGCSLNKEKTVDDSNIKQEITELKQQISDSSSQVETLNKNLQTTNT
jgi:outer membrane murein-binding lipoprotein Lpp